MRVYSHQGTCFYLRVLEKGGILPNLRPGISSITLKKACSFPLPLKGCRSHVCYRDLEYSVRINRVNLYADFFPYLSQYTDLTSHPSGSCRVSLIEFSWSTVKIRCLAQLDTRSYAPLSRYPGRIHLACIDTIRASSLGSRSEDKWPPWLSMHL